MITDQIWSITIVSDLELEWNTCGQLLFFPRIAKAEGEDSRFLHDSSNGQDNYSKKTRGGLQVLPN
jgi:hypothetical protein